MLSHHIFELSPATTVIRRILTSTQAGRHIVNHLSKSNMLHDTIFSNTYVIIIISLITIV